MTIFTPYFQFKNEVKYRIQWAGFGKEFNEWVNVEDCACNELIDEFEFSALQFIIGAGYFNGGIRYAAKFTYEGSLVPIESLIAANTCLFSL